MICKGCGKSYDGKGYWRALTTVHNPNYVICPSCNRNYKDYSKPIPITDLAERFKQMKKDRGNK